MTGTRLLGYLGR